jgi:DUF438 domain-containing protein
MNGGKDIKLLTKEAGEIAARVSPTEIAAAERRLLDSGYPAAAVTQLSAAFVLMGVYERQNSRPAEQAVDSHILRRVSAEHTMFRCLTAELGDVLEDIMGLDQMSDTSSEARRLAHAVRHLRPMSEHFDREDDVILPYMAARGWTGLCQLIARDHTQLRAHIDNLVGLVATFGTFEPQSFKSRLAAAITGFCACLLEHLSFEDGLLWPLMLIVIDDPATWKQIKALCDEIGYCGVHA